MSQRVRIQKDGASWSDHLERFRQECQAQANGFRREDLAYIATSVCAPRQRMAPIGDGAFDYMKLESQAEQTDRARIIKKLYDRLDYEHNELERIDKDRFLAVRSNLCWALLQTMSIEELRKMDDALPPHSWAGLPEFFENIMKTVDDWEIHLKLFFTQKLTDKQQLALETVPKKKIRSAKVKEACIERDKVCILTGEDFPQASHIYPFSGLNYANAEKKFRYTISLHWGGERADALHSKLFPAGIDAIFNVICLSPSMHARWSRYEFALLPLRPRQNIDGTWSIQVVFYWLKRRDVTTTAEMGDNALRTSAADVLKRDLSLNMDKQARAIDLRTNSPILDGQIFTIRAETEEKLPNYDILMLQWDIARMASLCAAAEPEDDSDSESSDGEDDVAMGSVDVDMISEEKTKVHD